MPLGFRITVRSLTEEGCVLADGRADGASSAVLGRLRPNNERAALEMISTPVTIWGGLFVKKRKNDAGRLAKCTMLKETLSSVALTALRSEEHTSELQSLMRISYAVFCLKKKKHKDT